MGSSVGGDRAEFGVLFVAGIGGQRPGSAVASLGAALFRWLFRWNRSVELSGPILGTANCWRTARCSSRPC